MTGLYLQQFKVGKFSMTRTTVAYGGIGNRVNQILNGLAAFPENGILHWDINRHCPLSYEEIFSENLGFSEIINKRKGDDNYIGDDPVNFWGSLDQYGPWCSYWYAGNTSMGVEIKEPFLVETYKRILNSMNASPVDDSYYIMGANYRSMGVSTGTLDDFLRTTLKNWKELNPAENDILFVLADKERSDISTFLGKENIPHHWCSCSEMKHDMDRSDTEQLKLFLSDYLTLNYCKTIVTSSCISTIVDPARAFGSTIKHNGPPRVDSNCWFVNHKPESFVYE